jgi:hypothetical protein
MAERNEPQSEADKLLAEVDGMLGGGTAPQRSVQPHGPREGALGPIAAHVRAAVMAGAVAGVGIWVLFAILPFLRATSGGIGAFLAAFGAVLIFRRRR